MEGYALSWPPKTHPLILKDQVSASSLTDAAERVPPWGISTGGHLARGGRGGYGGGICEAARSEVRCWRLSPNASFKIVFFFLTKLQKIV